MNREDTIKYFCLNNISIESSLRRLEKELNVKLLKEQESQGDIERTYYPQFTQRLRNEAESMAQSYTIFYCLENSIREIVRQRLEEEVGSLWWESNVPEPVKKNAESNMRREMQAAVTMRSKDPIDYTNFGELGEIIKMNWDVFGDMFTDIKALEKVMSTLNTLRAPIAHCKNLAEDEITRLHLGLRDWFRLME